MFRLASLGAGLGAAGPIRCRLQEIGSHFSFSNLDFSPHRLLTEGFLVRMPPHGNSLQDRCGVCSASRVFFMSGGGAKHRVRYASTKGSQTFHAVSDLSHTCFLGLCPIPESSTSALRMPQRDPVAVGKPVERRKCGKRSKAKLSSQLKQFRSGWSN
jgi:hypothetical protein